MNIAWIFCAIFLHGFFQGVLSTDKLEAVNASSNWVDNLIKYIKKTTNGQQITLLTDLKNNESMKIGPTIDKLFTRIVGTFYTLQMNILDFTETQEWILNHGKKDNIFFDSSDVLFIFIHYSSKPFDTPSARKTVDAIVEISAAKLNKQFLLVLVSQTLTDSLEDFLKHAWAHKLLDFTIFEFVETRTFTSPIRADYENNAPIIHQFNPFKMKYTKKNWTSNTEWFPNKVLNMWGYPLKIGVIDKPPFSVTTFDKYTDPVYVGGANIEFIKIIAKTLNFTMKYLSDVMKTSEMTRSEIPDNLFNLMASGKVDLFANLGPHYTENIKEVTFRTTPVGLNKLCTVIPILPRVTMPFSFVFFEAYAVYFGIVAVFWVSSSMMRFKSECWYPFNIARTIIGVSAVENPKRISERTLYTCLLLVSAIFSSKIYLAITSLSLQTDATMEIDSFHDLDVSNLRPEVSRYFFNKTFAFDADLINLKNKAIIRPEKILPMCANAAVKYKNTSCLLLNEEAMMAIELTKYRGRPMLKTTKLCFWADTTAFMLNQESPYRARLNHVIRLMQDTGLVDKCYTEATLSTQSVRGHRPDDPEDDDDDSGLDSAHNNKSLRQQLYSILIIGYAVSILAFIVEIVIYRIGKFWK